MVVKDHAKGRQILVRFLITLAAFVLGASIVGVYFIYRLFEIRQTGTHADFSQVTQGKLKVGEAPVSPHTARIFFTTDGRHLSAEFFDLPEDLTPYERITRLLDRLIRGPKSKYFEPVLPDKTSLRGVYIVDNEAILDFSGDLGKNLPGGISPELLAVYSIVNTVILNVEGVNKVQILVEGETLPTLAGEIDISAPLGANPSLVKW